MNVPGWVKAAGRQETQAGGHQIGVTGRDLVGMIGQLFRHV